MQIWRYAAVPSRYRAIPLRFISRYLSGGRRGCSIWEVRRVSET
jgi:hypothetical protein